MVDYDDNDSRGAEKTQKKIHTGCLPAIVPLQYFTYKSGEWMAAKKEQQKAIQFLW